ACVNLTSKQRLTQAQAARPGYGAIGHRGAQVHSSRDERREHAEENAGHHGNSKSKDHYASVEGNTGDWKKVFGQKQQKTTQSQKTDNGADSSANERQEEIFNPELTLNLPV